MRMHKFYLAVSLASLGLIGGCNQAQSNPAKIAVPTAKSDADVATKIRVDIGKSTLSACPGKDFPSFLKAFAADEHLREQFTLPMVSVVDYVDPAGGGGDSDETKVIKVPRSEYRQFTVRYTNGNFHHVSSDGTIDPDALHLTIKQEGENYFVGYTYGMSEGNSWLFRFDDQCWYLAEDPEAPLE